jgi:hypothetical protein
MHAQVSDLHISRFRPRSTATLARFVAETVPAIDPAYVVVTGDLTDGKDPRLPPSHTPHTYRRTPAQTYAHMQTYTHTHMHTFSRSSLPPLCAETPVLKRLLLLLPLSPSMCAIHSLGVCVCMQPRMRSS